MSWRLLGYTIDKALVGCIGVEITGRGSAVSPSGWRQGVGRMMIAQVCERLALSRVTAETDQDGVDFHNRCGFAVCGLGEQHPGAERFQCELHRND